MVPNVKSTLPPQFGHWNKFRQALHLHLISITLLLEHKRALADILLRLTNVPVTLGEALASTEDLRVRERLEVLCAAY